MDIASDFCYVPRSKEQKEAYVEQVREKVTENVVKISFENIKTHVESFTNGPPLFCASCQAVLNSLSIVSKDSDVSIWTCEFCSYTNRIEIPLENITIPKNTDVCYMLKENDKKPSQQQLQKDDVLIEEKSGEEDLDDQRTVIFCLDNSGSMSSGTVFKDEDGNSKYMSRKQCVEKALANQIKNMQQRFPNRKVGVVLFSKEVLVLGDGQSESLVISKDGTFEDLFEIGQSIFSSVIQASIGKTDDLLVTKYSKTRTNGTTALGPGLAVSLGLASQSSGTGCTVMLCTDGLSNEGIGKLDNTKEVEVYEKMGHIAKSLGIQIHIVTMRGMECDVRVLGELARQTGGSSCRVGPSDFNSNFTELMQKDLIASKVEITVQLHEGLQLIEGEPHSDLGNVTKDTTFTFQYAVKSEYDFKELKRIPLQCKIFLKTLAGHSMVRVITKMQELTDEKKKALEDVRIEILSKHANAINSREAQRGSADIAIQKNERWNSFISKEVVVTSSQPIQMLQKEKHIQNYNKLKAVITTKQQIENNEIKADANKLDDCAQYFYDCS